MRNGHDTGAQPDPMRVMVLSTDRRFREVASLLLARRGCEVAVANSTLGLSARLEREHTDVIVIDAGRSLSTAARLAAAVQAAGRPVGVVVVEDGPKPGLPALPTIPKWGAFAELFAAVRRAADERTEAASGAPS